MTFDMTKTVKSKTDQLNFDDFINGKSLTIKITDIKGNDAKDQPVSLSFENDGGKPYKPCLSMRRVLISVWGDEGRAYIGKIMTLFGDPNVVFGGVKVGGIRISHMSDLKAEKTIMLTATKANKKPYTVKPLGASPDPSESLLTAGMGAALLGVAALTAWKDALQPTEKESIRTAYTAWYGMAKEADKAKVA